MARDSIPFQVIKGTEEQIMNISSIQEGTLYFALDTRRIYYGSKNNILISMGGNSGFAYGNYSDLSIDDASPEFIDPLNFDSDEPIGLNVNDLILNSNGGFYKVTDVVKDGDYYIYETSRITVTGGSGGGGGAMSDVIITLIPTINTQNVLVGERVFIDFSYSAIYSNGLSVMSEPYFDIVVGPDNKTALNNIVLTEKNSKRVTLADRTSDGYEITELTPVLTNSSNRKIYIKVYVDAGGEELSTKQASCYINYTPASGIWQALIDAEKSTLIYDSSQDFNSEYTFSHNNALYHYIVISINGDIIYTSPIRSFLEQNQTKWSFSGGPSPTDSRS